MWSELAKPATPIDIYRRNLQRSYLDTVDDRLNGDTAPSDEVRALLRGELRALDAQIRKALPAVTDEVTRRHLRTRAIRSPCRSTRARCAPGRRHPRARPAAAAAGGTRILADALVGT